MGLPELAYAIFPLWTWPYLQQLVCIITIVQFQKQGADTGFFSFLYNSDGINTRVGAELLVQNNVFVGVKKPLYSTDNGYANASGNDFGSVTPTWLPSNALFLLRHFQLFTKCS